MNKVLALLATAVSILVLAFTAQGNAYTFMDAGGPQLRALIAGTGQPVVVFENGLGAELDLWRRTQDAVSTFTSTIAYDRAGTGGSSAGPSPRDGRQIALELHTALQNSGVPPPYVLVGHSIGGLYVRLYAAMYPDDVAALVLVDPSRHDEIDPDSVTDATYPELVAMPAAQQQARGATLAPELPVYLIMAMGARGAPWYTAADAEEREEFAAGRVDDLNAHTAWLDSLGNGHLIVTENSGHIVPVEETALVVDTIRRALDEL